MSELRIEVDDQTADQYESATPEEQAEARAAFARALRKAQPDKKVSFLEAARRHVQGDDPVTQEEYEKIVRELGQDALLDEDW